MYLFSDQVSVQCCARSEVGRFEMIGVAELKNRLPVGKRNRHMRK